ncbi:MAG: cation:proton antiporter [Candidatus Tenebribacter davisii]|jgi:Kef-type K+ transport system membrane component KefB|nr:cation:proton antiporter [Candidatus Tenebribacter davisii]
MENHILLHLAVIIFFSKILGAISRKLKQPPVVGMLLLGIILGPTILNFIEPDEVIKWIAKVGVLFLLFEAGLETNMKRIKEDSKQAILPAIGGITLPFILGFLLMYFVNHNITQALVVGVVFTATSVSVSVMTLLDLGKLKGIEGRCIVNSAIIDDIVGILLLTFVFGLTSGSSGSSTTIIISFAKIIAFFVIATLLGIFILKPFFLNLKKILLDNVVISLAIAVVLLYSWLAEMAGLAAITGAYFAGLFLGQTEYKSAVHTGIANIGKSFFVDVFFVSIGLQFDLFEIEAEPAFLLLFILFAIFGKMIGSGIGAKITKFDAVRSFRIGAGMIPRGEVALIVANMALAKGLVSTDILSATILLVIISALVTPLILKFSFTKFEKRSF